ncbi:MAG: hypothetical protein ABSG68_18760 [Thermoguttaceae bacterium]|jgi:hypothetical protein
MKERRPLAITVLFSKVVITLRVMNSISRSEMSTIVATLIDSPILTLCSIVACLALTGGPRAEAGTLTVDLGPAQGIALVGAIDRWGPDGNPRRPVDAKAKIDAPYVYAAAAPGAEHRWTFEHLPAGKYDLVLLTRNRVRIEGWQFAPVNEFDPWIAAETVPEDDARDFILDDVSRSQHYENRVEPLHLAGDKKAVRVLVMLVRDRPTSYEADFPGAATIRHEIWQYSWNYGGWQKEKRTRVLDRILLKRDELRQWTWLWDARLGGLEVGSQPVTLKYPFPDAAAMKTVKGLHADQ